VTILLSGNQASGSSLLPAEEKYGVPLLKPAGSLAAFIEANAGRIIICKRGKNLSLLDARSVLRSISDSTLRSTIMNMINLGKFEIR
jgi:hypothetical protein